MRRHKQQRRRQINCRNSGKSCDIACPLAVATIFRRLCETALTPDVSRAQKLDVTAKTVSCDFEWCAHFGGEMRRRRFELMEECH
jgi:hypothetical protein